MAVKFGVAIGAHTTVISRGTAKRQSALEDLKVVCEQNKLVVFT